MPPLTYVEPFGGEVIVTVGLGGADELTVIDTDVLACCPSVPVAVALIVCVPCTGTQVAVQLLVLLHVAKAVVSPSITIEDTPTWSLALTEMLTVWPTA